jgi:pimeloyl-ACP methyl ester carboxylesterase
MSSSGAGAVGQPHPEALGVLMTRPPDDLDGFLDWLIASRRVIGSPGFPLDEQRLRRLGRRIHERGIHPAGTQRQLVASICSGDRTAALRSLALAAVVIHGVEDALIDVSGGRATATAIPGAELVEIEGMGHDFPAAVWDRVAEAIVANVARAAEGPAARIAG